MRRGGDRLALDQFAGLFQVVEHDRGRIDAEGMIDRGQQVAGMDAILDGGGRRLVGLAVDVPACNASAGNHGGVAVGIVVAAVGGAAVAGDVAAPLRGAAKLADGHHQRFVQQSALVEVDEQLRKCIVEHRRRLVLHALAEPIVVVPRVFLAVGDCRPDDLDDASTRLDQSTGQQAALPAGVPAVEVAELGGLARQVERRHALPERIRLSPLT